MKRLSRDVSGRGRPTVALVVAVLAVSLAVGAPVARGQEPAWTEMGPTNVGGRVTAAAPDPSQADRLVAGTPAGGVWQTTTGGSSWQPVNLVLAGMPVSALAIDPGDPNHLVVGTGELSDGGAVSRGVGVLRSTDGGATWALEPVPSAAPYISDVLIWPGESMRVLAASDIGVRLSLDGGGTFTETLRGEAVSHLALDPFSSGVLASTRSGLFRSDDAGLSWTRLSYWPLLETDDFGAGTTNLALSASTNGLLYATVQVLGTLNQTARALLLRSADGGATFEEVGVPAFCPVPESCGFAQAIAVHPDTDARLLLAGEQTYVSNSAGASWQLVPGLRGVHQVLRSGEATYVVGRQGVGLLASDWTTVTSRNTGLAITRVTSLDVSLQGESRLLVGTMDAGTLLGTGTSPLVWRMLFADGGLGGTARFDPFDSARLLVTRDRGRVFHSNDGGVTLTEGIAGLDLTQSALDVAPLEPSPLVPGLWYTGRLQLFSSMDGAVSWDAYRPVGFPEIGVIAPSPLVDGRLYFAPHAGGALYKADGDTTDRLEVSAAPNLRLTAVLPDPVEQNRLYVSAIDTTTQRGRLFKSDDFGATWIDISPFEFPPTTSLVKDAFGALYVGTTNGVFRSANDGFTWAPVRRGMQAGGVTALDLTGGLLFAGTNGRGVFAMPERPLFSLEALPGGGQFSIDGQTVTGPYLVELAPGSTHVVEPVLQVTADVREEFLGWSDGQTTRARTITGGSSNAWLAATIRRAFRLQAAAGVGGTVAFVPSSPDGFYFERSFVSMVPIPVPDHQFAGFTGDLSGTDGMLGFALMDRPRTVGAQFTPLRTTMRSAPAGLPLTIDGEAIVAPQTYQWAAGSTHAVSAPAVVDLDPSDETVLAFDGWTDLRSRSHTFLTTRDTFVTDLTAGYIPTLAAVQVSANGTQRRTTSGQGDAPRFRALTVDGGAAALDTMQFVRSVIDGVDVSEAALVPSAPATFASAHVRQDRWGTAGRARLVFHNPSNVDARVGVLVRGEAGQALAAQADAVVVRAGAHATVMLDERLAVPESFEGLVTLIADRPISMGIHALRGILRPTTMLDPVLLAPFLRDDAGIPPDARVQVLLATPETIHRLVLFNDGFSPLTGSLMVRQDDGTPLSVSAGAQAGSTFSYNLAPGAFLSLPIELPALSAVGAPFATVQVRVQPAAGQPAPRLQLTEEHSLGTIAGQAAVLPRSIPASHAASAFGAPIDRSRRVTGMVFTNTSPLPVTLTIAAAAADGTVAATVERTVAAGAQLVVDEGTLFPSLGGTFLGRLDVTSSIPVHAVAYAHFENSRSENVVLGFPAWTDAATLWTYPLATDGDSFRTDVWLSKRSGTDGPVPLRFVDDAGRQAYLPFP